MSAAGASIEARPGLGNVLVATKSFKPGEVIVYEEPLLHVPHLKPSNPLYKPLQAFFEAHGIPSSVVLKIMTYFLADQQTQVKVLQCCCPDQRAFAEAAVVKQAKLFAQLLIKHPPVPEFTTWMQQCTAAAAAAAETMHQQQQQEDNAHCNAPDHDAFEDLLTKIWLIWVINGHSFRNGSALFHYGSKLTHTCSAPNTAYRTAAGNAAPVHGLAAAAAGSSAAGQLPPLAAAPAAAAAAAAAAGYHVALGDIQAGDILYTNYLGLGYKRLVSNPVRQKMLQDKFLFKCNCNRCTNEVDLCRGIPCPNCSANFRAPDKLLTEEAVLPDTAAAAAAGSSDRQQQCGYIYLDQSKVSAGADQPWTCDLCDHKFENNTEVVWGKFYTRSHSHIEPDMGNWVMKFDESIDTAPMIREPSRLHDRVLGIVRLLGARHWASWRLLLLGVELHCAILEQAAAQHKVYSAQAAAGSSSSSSQQQQQRVSDTAAEVSAWVVRYCQALWNNIRYKFGELEAGQLLGYHFTEAAQVLLQAASTPGLLPAAAGDALMDQALLLQQQVLPGLRSIMGQDYSPMTQLLQQAAAAEAPAAAAVEGDGAAVAAAGSSGGSAGRYVAASVKRYLQQQAVEAQKVQQLVAELRQLETIEDDEQEQAE